MHCPDLEQICSKHLSGCLRTGVTCAEHHNLLNVSNPLQRRTVKSDDKEDACFPNSVPTEIRLFNRNETLAVFLGTLDEEEDLSFSPSQWQ